MTETRVKLTEIEETVKVKRKERNKEGKLEDVEKTFIRNKEVRYITGWPRFWHFILDRIFFFALETIFLFSLGIGLGLLGWAGYLNVLNPTLTDIIFYAIFYPAYYFILETSSQSSLGKLIFGRVVVDEYGDKPTMKQIFIRSVSRIVPFEQLSCLSQTGWHDNWSQTFVISKKDLEELKTLAKLQVYLEEPKREMNAEEIKTY